MRNKKTYFVNTVLPSGLNIKNGCDEVDIEEAIDIAGVGRYNYLLLLTCCTIHLGAVVDMINFSLVAPAASCDLQLGLTEIGMLTSVSSAGFMFALPWGYFADTRGRRKALLCSASVGFIFAALTSIATSFPIMLVLKFMSCCFSSASLSLTVSYLGECTPKKHRSQFLFIQNCANLCAGIFCFGFAYIFLPMNFNVKIPWLLSYRPWRLLTFTMAFPLGLGSVMLVFLHESPKFLANKGETEKALNVLKSTYKTNRGSKELYPVKSLIRSETEMDPSSFWSSVVQLTRPLFKPPLLWRTLQLCYLLTIACSTVNAFFVWFPTMSNSFYNFNTEVNKNMSFCLKIVRTLSATHTELGTCNDTTPTNTIYSGILLALFFTSLNLAVVKLASWRKEILIVIFIISGMSAILINLIAEDIANLMLFVLIQITVIGIGNVGSYFVDMYPTSNRGLAINLGLMVAKIFTVGGVNIVGATIVDHCSLTFYCWAIFVLSGVVVSLFLPADRKRDT